MKKIFKIFLLSLILLFEKPNLALAALDEEITSFHSEIRVNQDTSITIKEKIEYVTSLNKHGIYRYLPLSYNKDGRKEVLHITDVKITDDAQQPIAYTHTSDGRFLTLKIGDPDKTFTGNKTYLISYSVQRALVEFEEHEELFWDITGEGWQIPIASSTATVTSEFAQIKKIDCFTGKTDSTDGLCHFNFTANKATFSYPEIVKYGNNFTILVGLEKNNQLNFPSQAKLIWLWFKYNWVILLTPLPISLLFLWWFKHGRDRQFVSANVFNLDPNRPTQFRPWQIKAREPFVYEPLKDLTPGETGAIIDEKVDNQDVIAEILDLARKKYLKIEVIEKKKLFGKNRDYQFTEIAQSTTGLPKVQSYLLDNLFKNHKVVKVSTLKGTFYTTMNQARSKIEQSLVDKKVYTRKPSTTKISGILAYLLLSFGVGGLVLVNLFTLGIYWPFSILILQLPFGIFLALKLPQKTAIGTNLYLQARGLKKSINYGKWREEIKEKNLFIEEVLPFAVALGVIDQLSKDMKKMGIKPPEYLSTTNLTTWSTAQFISSFSSEVSNSLSYNPASSSSSSGSGFSGGSSGGGGGGGGGGSW